MHPLLSRPSRLFVYIFAWLSIGTLLAMGLYNYQQRTWVDAAVTALPLSVFYGFVCLSAWWVCRSAPLAPDRVTRAINVQIGAALQASAVLVGAGTLWEIFLSAKLGMGVARAAIVRDAFLLFAVGIPAYMISAVAHYLFLGLQASHEAERRVLEAQVAAREAELRALRAQLNPHFLYNSLNSISALTAADPAGARRMCVLLADFLRETLAMSARDRITLADELALTDRFLGIEQVRFGQRLRVERHVDDAATRCRVPPLVLQPLMENAVTHGIAGLIEGGVIRLDVARRNDRLSIAIENPRDEDAPPQSRRGVGLENVRQRLIAMFGDDARLDTRLDPGMFRVEIALPFSDD